MPLKIDQSFVSGVGTTAETEAIIRAMVSLGGILGLRTLAKGIETEEQATRVLATLGVEGQGYLFSPPGNPSATSPPSSTDWYGTKRRHGAVRHASGPVTGRPSFGMRLSSVHKHFSAKRPASAWSWSSRRQALGSARRSCR